MKYIMLLLVAITMVSCNSKTTSKEPKSKTETIRSNNFIEQRSSVLNINGYSYILPSWWEGIQVNLPKDLNVTNDGIFTSYISFKYGKDTGTSKTWKLALKSWVKSYRNKNNANTPVYLAHCHRSGKEYKKAAQIYIDLYGLANNYGKNAKWLQAYLAYEAGNTFLLLNDKNSAVTWYGKSSEHIDSTDSVIKYYAETAREKSRNILSK